MVLSAEEERVQYLQSVLLDFLAINAEQDISWTHARHFYLCQWYIDNNTEKSRIAAGGTHKMHSRKQSRKKRSNKGITIDFFIQGLSYLLKLFLIKFE